RLVNGGFESSTDRTVDGWFYLRQATLEHEKAPEGKSYLTFSNREPGRDAHALQAFGIDGAKVRTIRMSLLAKADAVTPGLESYEKPALVVAFYDANNRRVGEHVIGPWFGSFPWRRFSADIRVPKESQMAIVQIGLRGSTGSLSVDDVRLSRR